MHWRGRQGSSWRKPGDTVVTQAGVCRLGWGTVCGTWAGSGTLAVMHRREGQCVVILFILSLSRIGGAPGLRTPQTTFPWRNITELLRTRSWV